MNFGLTVCVYVCACLEPSLYAPLICGYFFPFAARRWLHRDLTDNYILKYVVWVFFPVLLILFSSGFAHTVAPQAIGNYAFGDLIS